MKAYLCDLRETCKSNNINSLGIFPNVSPVQFNHHILKSPIDHKQFVYIYRHVTTVFSQQNDEQNNYEQNNDEQHYDEQNNDEQNNEQNNDEQHYDEQNNDEQNND